MLIPSSVTTTRPAFPLPRPKLICRRHSALYNSSVLVWDPATQKVVKSITFQGLTDKPELHASGIQFDNKKNLLSVMIDAGAAFAPVPEGGSRDISGANVLVKYDLKNNKEVFRTNLSESLQGAFGGFQDIEHDSAGNSFVVGTYPGSIMKVDPQGKVVGKGPWFSAKEFNDKNVPGLTGLAATGDTLLVSDEAGKRLLRFDMKQAQGTPTPVKIGKDTKLNITDMDGVYMPAMFKRRGEEVLLVSSASAGTTVLRSTDGWKSAENLGLIPNANMAKDQGFTTATVQMGQRVYHLIEYFLDKVPEGLTRSKFPLVDITDKIEQLVADKVTFPDN